MYADQKSPIFSVFYPSNMSRLVGLVGPAIRGSKYRGESDARDLEGVECRYGSDEIVCRQQSCKVSSG